MDILIPKKMTELTFLLELFMNHKLGKNTRQLIAERIREVEEQINMSPKIGQTYSAPQSNQVPSTATALARQAQIESAPPLTPPQVNMMIGQTVAASAAMTSRQQAISEAISGQMKSDRPRKF